MEFPKEQIESLWSPWRVEYFQSDHKPTGDFLEEAANATDDAAHLVVARRKSAFLIMNKYPYAVGHLMAAPYRKTGLMEDLSKDEAMELWELCIFAQTLLKKTVNAQGFNVGLNLGKAAGAGVQDHLHLHIVPRWMGDSNFMAVVGHTRILPEGLQPMYQRLVAARQEIETGG
ncbi:MAG: HIT domain-containing protein [Chthoniobacterales bacterium]